MRGPQSEASEEELHEFLASVARKNVHVADAFLHYCASLRSTTCRPHARNRR